jgi:GntR family transcriptional regulator
MVQNSPRRAHDLLRLGIRRDLMSRTENLSEGMITKGYATSRSAVREALQMLVDEGLVTRLPRFGTRITGRITMLPLHDAGSDVAAMSTVLSLNASQNASHNDLAAPAACVGAQYQELDIKLVPASPVLKERLEVDDDVVLLVEHLLSARGEPIYIRAAYLSAGDDVESRIKRVRDIYSTSHSTPIAMRELFGTEIGRVETTVEAVPCEPRTGRILGLAPGAPILLRERRIFGTDDRPYELSFTHLRGDRTALFTSEFH